MDGNENKIDANGVAVQTTRIGNCKTEKFIAGDQKVGMPNSLRAQAIEAMETLHRFRRMP